MPEKRTPISKERLLHLFDVDMQTGRLYWKNPPANHNEKLGREAGFAQNSRRDKKYWVVMIDGKLYKRGKLIYAIATGGWAEVLDHIDGDSLNDSPENVRAATIKQNVWNRTKGQSQCGLPMGVRRTPQGKFQVRIACHGKTHYLGVFDSIEGAQSAYTKKQVELFGEFSGVRGKSLNA